MKALSAVHKQLHAAWPTASLRTYLVVVILLATVPIAALMSYQIFADVNGQLGRMKINLKKDASSLAQGVEREIASSIDALTILSYSESIQRHDVDRFERALMVLPLLRPSWSGAYLVDLDGTVLFDTEMPSGRTPKNFKNGEDFQRVLANREAVVSNLLTDNHGQSKYVTAIQVPVVIDGQLRYVLGARINASVWQDLLEKTGTPANGFTTITDRDHRIIARTKSPEQFVGKRLLSAVIDSMGGRESGVIRTELLEGGNTYGAWDTVPTAHWTVGAGIPAEPLDAVHNKAIARAVATALSCLALGIFLALFVARRMTKPLHQLARNDLSRPFDRIAVREIALLRDALLAAQAQDEVARARLQNKRDQLQSKADEFETLFDNSPIGLAFAQDSQCRVVLHNAAMDVLFGPPESYGNGNVQVMHRGQRLDPADQPLQRAAARGERIKGMELELVINGRSPIFVLVNAVPLRDATGRPRGAIGAVVDITERKLAEARLIRAEQRLRESQHLVDLAQEAGHVGFFHYQFEDDSLTWTSGQAALFGMETMEMQGKLANWLRRLDQDDCEKIERTLQQMIAARQEKETLDFRVTLPDGTERWLSSRVLINYGDDAPLHMIGVTVDMTDQKEAERQRAALIEREQAARLEAEAANRAKDEFMAMLGHELRNPLSAISSAVEVLNRVDAASEIAGNARAIIGRQTLHLAHMMDDLLDVARVISGKVLLSRHPMDLSNLVRRVVATQEITGDASRHKLVLALDEAWIDADAVRMEQVVSNLLTNALKYTPSGGRITATVKREGAEAVFEVKDNGIGISPALLPRIFDLFVQGERTLDRRAGGLGIGLTLVRRLVNLHGGNIVAESSPEGSTFRVRMPAIDPLVAPQEPAGSLLSNRLQVAVIEDNQDALESLRSILECDGHTVVFTAANGRDGLSRLLETRPEVAIVDIGLPGLTGYEVAKRARAAGFAGRLVALSGYGQQRDIQQAMAAGFDAHFVKPVKTDQLRAMLMED